MMVVHYYSYYFAVFYFLFQWLLPPIRGHGIQQLPHCKKHMDTYGKWVNVSEIDINHNEFRSHFYPASMGAGMAINFTYAWLPDGCSYHRFTRETIRECVNWYIKNADLYHNLTTETVRVVFIGDSVLRGLYCSLARILVDGSDEIFGPVDNQLCGGQNFGSYKNTHPSHPWYNLNFFNDTLLFAFNFESSLNQPREHIDWMLEWTLTRTKSFAAVLGTGAWDFQPIPKIFPVKVPNNESCTTESETFYSASRMSPKSQEIYRDCSSWAKAGKTKLIYRNIHYNKRFGTYCCDGAVEEFLRKETIWDIYDSRQLSKDAWEYSMNDGLHIDRKTLWTVEQHKFARELAINANVPLPGQLEMQLTHSFLNNLFHEALHNLYPHEH